MNSHARAHSGPVPETSWSLIRENQKTNEDHSQDDPDPDMGVSLSQSSQYIIPEETSYGDYPNSRTTNRIINAEYKSGFNRPKIISLYLYYGNQLEEHKSVRVLQC